MTNAVCSCDLRKKIVIAIIAVLDEEECGVSDSALADAFDPDLPGPDGKPVLRMRYCGWCGKVAPKPEHITDFNIKEMEEREPWQQDPEPDAE